MLIQQQLNAAVSGTPHTRRPEVMKVDTSKYREFEDKSLLLWFVDRARAIKARRIDDEQTKLTFAQIHLAWRAKVWTLGI